MRRNELDPRLRERVLPQLEQAESAVIIGAELSSATLTCSASVQALTQQPGHFAAGLWLVADDIRANLVLLRRVLAAGATLWLAAQREPHPLQRLRALVGGERVKTTTLPELCGALLLAGFVAPRVHPQVAGFLLVSAELPSMRDALDAFFEQPSAS